MKTANQATENRAPHFKNRKLTTLWFGNAPINPFRRSSKSDRNGVSSECSDLVRRREAWTENDVQRFISEKDFEQIQIFAERANFKSPAERAFWFWIEDVGRIDLVPRLASRLLTPLYRREEIAVWAAAARALIRFDSAKSAERILLEVLRGSLVSEQKTIALKAFFYRYWEKGKDKALDVATVESLKKTIRSNLQGEKYRDSFLANAVAYSALIVAAYDANVDLLEVADAQKMSDVFIDDFARQVFSELREFFPTLDVDSVEKRYFQFFPSR